MFDHFGVCAYYIHMDTDADTLEATTRKKMPRFGENDNENALLFVELHPEVKFIAGEDVWAVWDSSLNSWTKDNTKKDSVRWVVRKWAHEVLKEFQEVGGLTACTSDGFFWSLRRNRCEYLGSYQSIHNIIELAETDPRTHAVWAELRDLPPRSQR